MFSWSDLCSVGYENQTYDLCCMYDQRNISIYKWYTCTCAPTNDIHVHVHLRMICMYTYKWYACTPTDDMHVYCRWERRRSIAEIVDEAASNSWRPGRQQDNHWADTCRSRPPEGCLRKSFALHTVQDLWQWVVAQTCCKLIKYHVVFMSSYLYITKFPHSCPNMSTSVTSLPIWVRQSPPYQYEYVSHLPTNMSTSVTSLPIWVRQSPPYQTKPVS